jgi:hypothetical protein
MVAVLILLVAVLCDFFIPFSESVAWADVQESFSQQPCLHYKIGEHPYETEFWVRLNPPQIFMKAKRPAIWEFGGGQEDRCYVMDYALGQKWTYNSLRKTIVTSSLSASEQEEEPADYIHYAQHMAALLGQGELYGYDIVMDNESPGRETRFQLMQSGVKLASIYVDDSNHLPTYIRVYQDPNDANVVSDSYQDLYFDYPPISPTSIRDLGIPEDIAVIQIDPPEPELLKLAETHDSARRLIMNCQGMSLFITSQQKQNESHWCSVGILQALGKQEKARDISMHLGQGHKSRTVTEVVDSILGVAPWRKKTEEEMEERAHSLLPKWHDWDDTGTGILSQCVFPDVYIPLKPKFQHMVENSGDGQWRTVHSDDPALSSAIGLQLVNHASGKTLNTWWLDPEHDYWVCGYDLTTVEAPKHRAPHLILEMTYRVKSFARTSEGKWYPSRIEQDCVAQNGDEVADSWDIHLEELSQSDTRLTRDFLIRAFSHLVD